MKRILDDVLNMEPERKALLLQKLLSNYRVINECWVWQGRLFKGYGQIKFSVNSRETGSSTHRTLWLLVKGPIARGLELDHLCRNRACMNLKHLEPVTHAENIRRGPTGTNTYKTPKPTRCNRGHLFSEVGAYVSKKTGRRRCRKCNLAKSRAAYVKRKSEAA